MVFKFINDATLSFHLTVSSREKSRMSTAAFSTAMLEAYKKGLGVDYSLICQGVVKKVHSQVWPLESELIRSSL